MSLHLSIPMTALRAVTLPLSEQGDGSDLTAVAELVAMADDYTGSFQIRVLDADDTSEHVRVLTDLLSMVRRRRGGDGLVALVPDSGTVTIHVASLVAS